MSKYTRARRVEGSRNVPRSRLKSARALAETGSGTEKTRASVTLVTTTCNRAPGPAYNYPSDESGIALRGPRDFGFAAWVIKIC